MLDKSQISLWFDQLPQPQRERPRLEENLDADAVIVGAGFTGLWTAYYLKQMQPRARVIVLEARTAGYGASGRNGGWLMGTLEGLEQMLAPMSLEERREAYAEVHGLVDEVARVASLEGIDCGLAKGGALSVAARFPEQLPWARAYYSALQAAGHSEQDYRWLSAAETAQRVCIDRPLGAVYTPHVAAIQPAKLVRGLAGAAEKAGVCIFENSEVLSMSGRESGSITVSTQAGSVRAERCVLALEGFHYGFNPNRSHIIPLQSNIIATEPLSTTQWNSLGFANRETMCDMSRMHTYLQRSADDRLIFGARGHYHFAARSMGDRLPSEHDKGFKVCRELMQRFFPQLGDVEISHVWAGTFGMARRFQPHIIFDQEQGIATAGGYGGEGVGTANLFGRTLAEMLAGKSTLRTGMPWVHRCSVREALPRWEPEPFRWLVYALIAQVFSYEEELYSRPSASRAHKRCIGRAANVIARILE